MLAVLLAAADNDMVDRGNKVLREKSGVGIHRAAAFRLGGHIDIAVIVSVMISLFGLNQDENCEIGGRREERKK